jgi:hypothetical protein
MSNDKLNAFVNTQNISDPYVTIQYLYFNKNYTNQIKTNKTYLH